MLKRFFAASLLVWILAVGAMQAGFVPVFFTMRNIVHTPTEYTFDVYAEVAGDTLVLNTYQLYIAYDTTAFGADVVLKGRFSNLTVSNPDVSLYGVMGPPLFLNKYKLVNVVDNSFNILAITVDPTLSALVPTPACYPADTGFTTIFVPGVAQPIAQVTFTFLRPAQPPGVSLYLTLMVDQFIGGVGGMDSCTLSQGDPSILPVAFEDVAVQRNTQAGATVSWEVSQELQLKHYDVERSLDGDHFTSLGLMPAMGVNDYVFTDMEAPTDAAYYRIKAVDIDGNFMLSETVELTGLTNARYEVFPNPSHQQIYVRDWPSDMEASAHILDIQGKTVWSGSLSTKGISVADLPAGMYILRWQDAEGRTQHRKFHRA